MAAVKTDRYCPICRVQKEVDVISMNGRSATFLCDRGHKWPGRLKRRELSDSELIEMIQKDRDPA